MKKCIILLFAFISMVNINAQVITKHVSKGIIENRNNYKKYSSIKIVKMPSIDVEALLAEDEEEIKLGLPFRFGYSMQVNLNMRNSGNWTEFEDSNRIWTLNIVSKGAYSINLAYDEFYIPEGGQLYIYNMDKTVLQGPITSEYNTHNGNFATDLIQGESIILEYYEPYGVKEKGKIRISKVVHGYKNLFSETTGVFGQSDSCNIDVNCPEGQDWEDESNSVAMILVGDNRICSGALINNTCQDFIPYFLTANHCVQGENVGTWTFRFQYKSSTCGGGDDYSYYSYYGASLEAHNSVSDFALLELNQRPAGYTGITYSGWSRSSAAPSSAVSLHHPTGDVMKISFENNSPIKTNYPGFSGDNHWQVIFDEGTAEGGSSGGPLYDPNHRIIGQLHGGNPGCTSNLNFWYGSFDVSWYLLSDFLDPNNTGAMTTNTIDIPTISGSTAVCISNSTFTLNNRPSGTNVNWTRSSNLSYVSGQGTDNYTVEPASSTIKEWGWVQAEISRTGCDAVTVSKNVWIGQPAAQILGLTELAPYSSTTYTASHYYNCPIDSYLWRISSPLYAFSYFPNTNQSYEIESRGNLGTFYLYLTTTNTCGSQNILKSIVVTDDGGGTVPRSVEEPVLLISPNPANNYIEVKIQDESLNFDNKQNIKVALFNNQSIPVYINNFNNNEFNIDVSKVSNGLYLLQVIYKGEKYSEHVLIEH
ncbi:MAG: trypsin-like peptidase domain-containing protein [Bacteroidales bacterium]|nr:trypsin-like peptidase domain-containing protein [Bacteroidales bacterium]